MCGRMVSASDTTFTSVSNSNRRLTFLQGRRLSLCGTAAASRGCPSTAWNRKRFLQGVAPFATGAQKPEDGDNNGGAPLDRVATSDQTGPLLTRGGASRNLGNQQPARRAEGT
jgi:hypothetical protein